MKTVLTFLSLWILVIATPCRSQFEHFYENWRWAHFTTGTGLPSNFIEEIVETDDNTVWVSTYKGIAWYDGYRWNPIVVDSRFPEQHAKKIESFYNDKLFVLMSGSLYIGNIKGFSKVNLSLMPPTGMVNSICAVDSATYLCVYENYDSTYLIKVHNNNASIVPRVRPGNIFKTNRSIWILGESEGGYTNTYKLLNDSLINFTTPLHYPSAIRDIVENSDGKGLIAIDAPKQNIGIWEYDNNNTIKYSSSERNQPIRALDISENGEVIVVYESGEIHIKHNGMWRNIDPLPKQMLNIATIQYRKNNDIWLGTENGLYLFKRQKNLWTSNSSQFSDLKNVVMEIFQAANEDVWVGTMNGVEVHKNNGQRISFESINGRPIGLVTGINEDNNHHIWISTGAGFYGAYEWDGQKWNYHRVGSTSINYHKIRKDIKGNLIFLGLGVKPDDPAGYILSDNHWTRIDSMYSLSNNRLYAFSESHTGVKWFGTGSGLTRVKDGKTTHWGRQILGKNTKVYTLAVDDNEHVWFSTFSPQLGTIGNNDSVIWIWKEDEIYNYKQKVWDLSFDKNGILWAATTRGLFRYFNSSWSNYSHETGMYIRELRVVFPTRDRIYIGGHGIGLRWIDRKPNESPIQIYISKPIVESNNMYCSWDAESYWGTIPSEQIETRYKVDTNGWSSWNTNSNIVLTNLQSGEHTLFVQAKDFDGYIHSDDNFVTFVIEPPIYYRPIFFMPLMTMLCVAGFTVVRYKKAQKEHKVMIQNQRTRISNDLHDEVGSNLGSIALISQRLGRNESLTQMIKDELAIITETSLQTSEFLRDIVWYINPRYDTFMNLEARLREISGRMLRDIDVQILMGPDNQPDVKFIESRRNIILMFKEVLHNIIKHSKAMKVVIRCEKNANSFLLSVKDNGVGFNPELALNGNGLRSIKMRAEEVGAQLKIVSHLGEGTEVIMVFRTNVNTL